MLLVFLSLCAGFCNAVMDKYQFHYDRFIFRDWKMFSKDSWKNKWKNGDPKQGEAFPG